MSTPPLSDEFTHPWLVAVYDAVNAYEPDAQPRFYRGLAAEVGARHIVDLGCGTGLITCDLARRGYRMIGVDPPPAWWRWPGSGPGASRCAGSWAEPTR